MLDGAVPEPGWKVTFAAPGDNADRWMLSGVQGEQHDAQRVILLEGGFTGGVAYPTMERPAAPTGYGVRVAEGFSLPEMTGGLSVVVTSAGDPAGRNLRDWRRAWSATLPAFPGGPTRPGRLIVEARDGGNYWCPVVLASGPESPEREPAHVELIPDSVEWVSPAGCWNGRRHEYEAGAHTVVPAGDLSPHVELVWDGTPGTIVFPNGSSLTLGTAAAGPYTINLDRGMYGHTTGPDGKTARHVWAAFRGTVSGVTLAPHMSANFTIPDGVKLVISERFYTPWG